MEDAADFQDWELLQGPDDGVSSVSLADSGFPSSGAAVAIASAHGGGDSGGVVKLELFGPDSLDQSSELSFSPGGDGEPDNNAGNARLLESGSVLVDAAALCTAEESPDWKPLPPHDDLEDGHGGMGSSRSVVVLEGVYAQSREQGYGDSIVVENESEGSGEPVGPRMPTMPDSQGSSEKSVADNLRIIKGGKMGMVWWKLPVEFFKFCAFRIKPLWSISLAAAVVGVVILRKQLLKRKPGSKSITQRVSVDNKVSQSMLQATPLSKASSAVKWVPVIRSTLASVGVAPWPAPAFR